MENLENVSQRNYTLALTLMILIQISLLETGQFLTKYLFKLFHLLKLFHKA